MEEQIGVQLFTMILIPSLKLQLNKWTNSQGKFTIKSQSMFLLLQYIHQVNLFSNANFKDGLADFNQTENKIDFCISTGSHLSFSFFLLAMVLVPLCFVPTENGSFIIDFHSCQTPTSSYSTGYICSRRAMVISTCLSIIGALCSSYFSSVRKYVAHEKWWENKDMQTDTQRNYFSSNKRIISPAERQLYKIW